MWSHKEKESLSLLLSHTHTLTHNQSCDKWLPLSAHFDIPERLVIDRVDPPVQTAV